MEVDRAPGPSHRWRELAGCHERSVGDPDARPAGDGTEVDRQPCPPGVIEPGGVHEQHVGIRIELGDHPHEDRALAQGEQAGEVRLGDPIRHDHLVDHV
jgi:hypothetical protein